MPRKDAKSAKSLEATRNRSEVIVRSWPLLAGWEKLRLTFPIFEPPIAFCPGVCQLSAVFGRRAHTRPANFGHPRGPNLVSTRLAKRIQFGDRFFEPRRAGHR